MYVLIIRDSTGTGRILGTWADVDDAQDYGIDHCFDDEWYVHPIAIVNDAHAPRSPHFGGTVIKDVKVVGDLL